MDESIVANIIDIVKFLGYKGEPLSVVELEVLQNNIIDIYKIKYSICDPSIETCVKQSFVAKYHFIHSFEVVDEEDNVDVIDDTNIIDTYVMSDVTSQKFKPVIMKNTLTVEERDIEYEKLINAIKPTLEERELKLTVHYDHLRNLPQPVQKSKEWFDMRNNMITASMAADIIGESKYGTREEALLDKLNLLPDKFKENMFVYHGKKYERIAILIYEHIYNTKIGEFGLIPYQNDHTDVVPINYMGASPDGISTCITLDGKPNKLVGRMLEIKCPLKRVILTKGVLDGEIVPHYYWIQAQVQMAVCKCNECDFWQCFIKEYDDDEWYADEEVDGIKTVFTQGENGEQYSILHRLTKGCIIQLMPKDKSKIPVGERPEWYAKYIYPSNILMTDDEYEQWCEHIKNNWMKLYPQYKDGYYYDKILYWKLQSCHNVLIKRDIEWFNSRIPKFKLFWDEVLKVVAVLQMDKNI